MDKERLQRIEEYLKSGHYTPEIAHELLDEVKRLRENFEWIKTMENDFYNVVSEGLLGELRRLNPVLAGYSGQFSSLYGAVNEALEPKYLKVKR